MQCSACGHEVHAGKGRCMYCGADLQEAVEVDEAEKRAMNGDPSMGKPLEGLPWPFALERTKRRAPWSRVTLVIIFFASAVLMGAIVFLLGK